MIGQSGWDKRQATIQLTAFGDGVPRVPPLIYFKGQGKSKSILNEIKHYHPGVAVQFNKKAYCDGKAMVKYVKKLLVPAFGDNPSLLVIDLLHAHKTPEVKCVL